MSGVSLTFLIRRWLSRTQEPEFMWINEEKWLLPRAQLSSSQMQPGLVLPLQTKKVSGQLALLQARQRLRPVVSQRLPDARPQNLDPVRVPVLHPPFSFEKVQTFPDHVLKQNSASTSIRWWKKKKNNNKKQSSGERETSTKVYIYRGSQDVSRRHKSHHSAKCAS